MADAIREGGCGGGHVRYRVEGEPIFVNNCHCRLCQRQTGSTSVVNAFFESERVTLLEGELTDHTVTAGSGAVEPLSAARQPGHGAARRNPRRSRRMAARRGDLHREQDAVGRAARRHSGVRDGLQPVRAAPARTRGAARGDDRAEEGGRGMTPPPPGCARRSPSPLLRNGEERSLRIRCGCVHDP